ncbi:HAMP domain-containing histidine kinase [Candidatus Gottesmanbacteria bacterium]|nr:HAMP domain-containing histidine kinase [Candidatus Gottesmanbacteria bacterium]
MNTKSMRFRVSMWYTSIFSFAMAVLFVSFYFLTQQSLLSHTDAAIASHTDRIIDIIAQKDGNAMDSTFVNNSQAFAHQFTEMPGMVLIIGDPLGKILYSSQSLGGNEAVAEELLEKSANIIKPTFVNRSIGTSTVRLGVFPAKRSNDVKTLVIMGQPMDIIQNSLNALVITLVVVYIGVFILSLLGGIVLAGKAMNPVAAMSHQLKKISAENLNERVPNPITGDELEELSETFNGLLDNLHKAFARERQFIGDMAHELKTPLATIKSTIELTLHKARTNDDYKKAYADTLIDVNRLEQTVKNILDLAWIGAENAHTLKGTVDLSRIASDLQEIAEKLATEKKITVKATIASGVVIEGAEDKIFRSLLNIIDNAIKYTPSGKSVSLSVKKNKHHAFFVVKDTGVGISPDEQAHMFERFYRGSRTSRTVGSGLGLAIAHDIIKAHRGDIQVSSKPVQGTTMTVVLPLAGS